MMHLHKIAFIYHCVLYAIQVLRVRITNLSANAFFFFNIDSQLRKNINAIALKGFISKIYIFKIWLIFFLEKKRSKDIYLRLYIYLYILLKNECRRLNQLQQSEQSINETFNKSVSLLESRYINLGRAKI